MKENYKIQADKPAWSLCSYVELLTSVRQPHQRGRTSRLLISYSAVLSLLHTDIMETF